MKKNLKMVLGCILLYNPFAHAQHLSLKLGANYNNTLQKEIPNNPAVQLSGFDPKYGYQVSGVYTHVLKNAFYLTGEVGFINKGHNALDPATKEKLYEINYNYLYVRPALGYKLPLNFSAEMGIPIGFYLPPQAKPLTVGIVRKQEVAFSAHLNWEYKKVGTYIGFQQSLHSMQDIDFLGLKMEHRHRTFTTGISYHLF